MHPFHVEFLSAPPLHPNEDASTFGAPLDVLVATEIAVLVFDAVACGLLVGGKQRKRPYCSHR